MWGARHNSCRSTPESAGPTLLDDPVTPPFAGLFGSPLTHEGRGPSLAKATRMHPTLTPPQSERRADANLRIVPADLPHRAVETEDLVSLPELARHVLDIVLADGDTVPSHRVLVWAAVRYGVSRNLVGQACSVVDEEMALLRLAASQRIRRTVTDTASRERVLSLLDRSMVITERAAMLGFNRESLRVRGRWDAELQSVLRSSPFVSAA